MFCFVFGNTRHFTHIISCSHHLSPLVGHSSEVYLILHMRKLRQREHVYLVKDQIPQRWQREDLNLSLILPQLIPSSIITT